MEKRRCVISPCFFLSLFIVRPELLRLVGASQLDTYLLFFPPACLLTCLPACLPACLPILSLWKVREEGGVCPIPQPENPPSHLVLPWILHVLYTPMLMHTQPQPDQTQSNPIQPNLTQPNPPRPEPRPESPEAPWVLGKKQEKREKTWVIRNGAALHDYAPSLRVDGENGEISKKKEKCERRNQRGIWRMKTNIVWGGVSKNIENQEKQNRQEKENIENYFPSPRDPTRILQGRCVQQSRSEV